MKSKQLADHYPSTNSRKCRRIMRKSSKYCLSKVLLSIQVQVKWRSDQHKQQSLSVVSPIGGKRSASVSNSLRAKLDCAVRGRNTRIVLKLYEHGYPWAVLCAAENCCRKSQITLTFFFFIYFLKVVVSFSVKHVS